MRRKIMIASTSDDYKTLKLEFLDTLRRNKIPYSKNTGESILCEGVSFHFFAMNYRNMDVFQETHKHVDKVFFAHKRFLNQFNEIIQNKDGIVEKIHAERTSGGPQTRYWHYMKVNHAKTLMELVEHDTSRLEVLDNTPALLLRELGNSKLKEDIVDVFLFTSQKTLEPVTILRKDFRRGQHYFTKEQAIQELTAATEDRIRQLRNELNDKEKFLKYIQTL